MCKDQPGTLKPPVVTTAAVCEKHTYLLRRYQQSGVAGSSAGVQEEARRSNQVSRSIHPPVMGQHASEGDCREREGDITLFQPHSG